MQIPADTAKLEDYFLERVPRQLGYSTGIDLLLLLLEEKPGALVMGVSPEQERFVKRFCREFGLEYLYNRHLGFWERFRRRLGIASGFDNPGIAVARSRERLEVLERSEINGFTSFKQGSLGRFLGYPEEAVEFYAESDDAPGMVVQQKIEKLVEDGEIDEEDLAYMELVDYVPPPELESIEAAINRGMKRKDLLLEFDSETGSSIGERYLDELLETHPSV